MAKILHFLERSKGQEIPTNSAPSRIFVGMEVGILVTVGRMETLVERVALADIRLRTVAPVASVVIGEKNTDSVAAGVEQQHHRDM